MFSRVSACFLRAFPKNQQQPEKMAPTGRHSRHVFATLTVPLCTTLHPSLALKIHSVPHPSWHRKRFALLLTAKAFLPEIAIKGEAHLSLLML